MFGGRVAEVVAVVTYCSPDPEKHVLLGVGMRVQLLSCPRSAAYINFNA